MSLSTIKDLASLIDRCVPRLVHLYRNLDRHVKEESRSIRGKTRELLIPSHELMVVQRAINEKLLKPSFEVLECSHGVRRNSSALSCALAHRTSKYIIHVDIQKFFPSIHYTRIRRLFESRLHVSSLVAKYLTRLCTYKGKLPQGFPTSSIIADQILRNVDRRVLQMCEKHRLIYARYVDDLTISAPYDIRHSSYAKIVRQILRDNGFRSHVGWSKGAAIGGSPVRAINDIDIVGYRLDKDGWQVGSNLQTSLSRGTDFVFALCQNLNLHDISEDLRDIDYYDNLDDLQRTVTRWAQITAQMSKGPFCQNADERWLIGTLSDLAEVLRVREKDDPALLVPHCHDNCCVIPHVNVIIRSLKRLASRYHPSANVASRMEVFRDEVVPQVSRQIERYKIRTPNRRCHKC